MVQYAGTDLTAPLKSGEARRIHAIHAELPRTRGVGGQEEPQRARDRLHVPIQRPFPRSYVCFIMLCAFSAERRLQIGRISNAPGLATTGHFLLQRGVKIRHAPEVNTAR